MMNVKNKKEREKEKKKKKSDKKRKKCDIDGILNPRTKNDDVDVVKERGAHDRTTGTTTTTATTTTTTTRTIKKRLQSKKAEKLELLKQVPTTDEHGIAYTKIQIRRMVKRVKKGLSPVPTPRELEESRQNEARIKREEESLYAGLSTQTNTNNKGDYDTDRDNTKKNTTDSNSSDEELNDAIDDGGHECTSVVEGDDDGDGGGTTCFSSSIGNNDLRQNKKLKRNKPVPSDYICQACKNRHTPAHWIYDCPDKKTVRGTNQKKKRERGIHDPDSKKVFVSGLPFTVTTKGVEAFFSETNNCGIVSSVRLVKFDDTGRCNGQAFVIFNTDEGAKLALELSGTIIDTETLLSSAQKKKKDNKGKKSGATDLAENRKQLKLKVSKVLNRKKTIQRS